MQGQEVKNGKSSFCV